MRKILIICVHVVGICLLSQASAADRSVGFGQLLPFQKSKSEITAVLTNADVAININGESIRSIEVIKEYPLTTVYGIHAKSHSIEVKVSWTGQNAEGDPTDITVECLNSFIPK